MEPAQKEKDFLAAFLLAYKAQQELTAKAQATDREGEAKKSITTVDVRAEATETAADGMQS